MEAGDSWQPDVWNLEGMDKQITLLVINIAKVAATRLRQVVSAIWNKLRLEISKNISDENEAKR